MEALRNGQYSQGFMTWVRWWKGDPHLDHNAIKGGGDPGSQTLINQNSNLPLILEIQIWPRTLITQNLESTPDF